MKQLLKLKRELIYFFGGNFIELHRDNHCLIFDRRNNFGFAPKQENIDIM